MSMPIPTAPAALPTTDLHELRRRIRELALLPDSGDPLVSAYLDLRRGAQAADIELGRRLGVLERVMPWRRRTEFRRAADAALATLRGRSWDGIAGLALFTRGGASPLVEQLPFSVPFQDWVSADTVPHLYPLVELKDSFDRYFLLLLGVERVRLLEITLGAVSREVLLDSRGLADRAGRVWGRSHYQRSPGERPEETLRELLAVAERHVAKAGPSHLMLAGDPGLVARCRPLLSPALRGRDLETLPLDGPAALADIVRLSLERFADQEERHSRAVADRLREAVSRHALGAVGPAATWAALRDGQADVLVLQDGAALPEVYRCPVCSELQPAPTCAACGLCACHEADLREELVLQAERTGAAVEVVREHDWLRDHQGVGCLLRYGPAPRVREWPRPRAAALATAG